MPRLADYGIDKLSVEERYELLHELEKSLEGEVAPPGHSLTDAKRAELRRRVAEHDANPDDVIPWEQVKAEATARWQR